MMRVRGLVVAVLALLVVASGAWAAGEPGKAVDLELVLAVDASGSITTGTLEFQLRGHAAAFRDPQVADALTVGGNKAIAVTLVQWAGPNTLETVVPWTRIGDPADAKRFADSIAEMTRPPRDGSTAPAMAQMAFMPARTLGAPHTILSRVPVPASTVHTLRRSAFGWRTTSSTSATSFCTSVGFCVEEKTCSW